MNNEVIVTCAVTGAGDTVGKHPAIPVTPKQIADAAIEAAKAGATVCHMPCARSGNRQGRRDVKLYREVVDRIRSSGVDMIVNLTAGMGGDLEIGAGEDPMKFGPNCDLVGPLDAPRACRRTAAGNLHARLRHAQFRRRRPDLCLDAEAAARRRQAHAGAGREAGAGSLRHRPSLVRQADAQGRPARRAADVPALPRHSVGRAGRHRLR